MTNASGAQTKEYPKPSLTADVIAISLSPSGSLLVLLIQRARDPFRGRWALPGGFSEPGESVEQSAARELMEETGIKVRNLEQLRTFSAPGRDPRGWVVSVAHLALVRETDFEEPKGGDDADNARWWAIEHQHGATPPYRLIDDDGAEAGPLAFDHDEILTTALTKLSRDAGTYALDLCSAHDSGQLRKAEAAILGRKDASGERSSSGSMPGDGA